MPSQVRLVYVELKVNGASTFKSLLQGCLIDTQAYTLSKVPQILSFYSLQLQRPPTYTCMVDSAPDSAAVSKDDHDSFTF